ncbi:MAG: prepilin-type N-terminal cleavage/methylation domain-containing protein [Oceanipulchritudo sp.]
MRRGFTLIELIIVIALIALIGGLVAVNAQAILRGLGEEPVDRILRKAVREARYQAASLKSPVQLAYDRESASLVLFSDTGQTLESFRTVPEDSEDPPDIEFEQILPVRGLDSFDRHETTPIDAVVFRPDRSSTPFQVLIDSGNTFYTQRYDPFSAIVIEDSRND